MDFDVSTYTFCEEMLVEQQWWPYTRRKLSIAGFTRHIFLRITTTVFGSFDPTLGHLSKGIDLRRRARLMDALVCCAKFWLEKLRFARWFCTVFGALFDASLKPYFGSYFGSRFWPHLRDWLCKINGRSRNRRLKSYPKLDPKPDPKPAQKIEPRSYKTSGPNMFGVRAQRKVPVDLAGCSWPFQCWGEIAKWSVKRKESYS